MTVTILLAIGNPFNVGIYKLHLKAKTLFWACSASPGTQE